MTDALEEHDGKVSIGDRNITNLRFADDIYALAEEEQELEAKAALLLWFFGDFRCDALLFVVIHVIYKYKNR